MTKIIERIFSLVFKKDNKKVLQDDIRIETTSPESKEDSFETKILMLKLIHERLALKDFQEMNSFTKGGRTQGWIRHKKSLNKNFDLRIRNYYDPIYKRNTTVCFVTKNEDTIGYCKLVEMTTVHSKVIWRVEYLYLTESYRGKGLGTLLIKKMTQNKLIASNFEGESDQMRKIWVRLGLINTNSLNVYKQPILSNYKHFSYFENNNIDYFIKLESDQLNQNIRSA